MKESIENIATKLRTEYQEELNLRPGGKKRKFSPKFKDTLFAEAEQNRISVYQLAIAMGISHSTVFNWQRALRGTPISGKYKSKSNLFKKIEIETEASVNSSQTPYRGKSRSSNCRFIIGPNGGIVEASMIPSLSHRQVWVYMNSVDMRMGYDRLYGLARSFHSAPRNGDIFLFVSSDRKKAKALFWSRNGLMILMKRLELGSFAKIFSRGRMTPSELDLFFEGSHQVEKNLSVEDLTDRFLD